MWKHTHDDDVHMNNGEGMRVRIKVDGKCKRNNLEGLGIEYG